MFGKLLGTLVVMFLVSFVIGTGVTIISELISRRKRAASSQNLKSEEVDTTLDVQSDGK